MIAPSLATGLIVSITFSPPGLRGGGPAPVPPPGFSCVSAALRAQVAATRPAAGTEQQLAAPPLFPFDPIGGRHHADVFPGGFVDLDPTSPGYYDFSCRAFAYDGHRGQDVGLRSFAEQAIGVPVFAVRDGVVLFAQDGFEDMNTASSTNDGNYIILDHGSGQQTWYFHLRKNSVAFQVGQPVKEGDQVGLAASSGFSFGPHLHFEVQQNNVAVEPHAGDCRPGPSGFAMQEPLDLSTFLYDFGVTTVDLTQVAGLPHPMPTDAQVGFTDTFTRFWLAGANLPPHSTWRVRWFRPNGTVALDSLAVPFANPEWWRTYWFWWEYDLPEMHTTAGTWRVEVDFNGAVLIDAPIEVVATKVPGFNRPPAPIQVAFDPATPGEGRSVACRVGAPVLLEDLDWDVVRYRYQWMKNGLMIRDVVHAGRVDRLPRDAVSAGDSLLCTVTPNDGKIDGAPASSSATVTTNPWTNLGAAKHGGPGVPHLLAEGDLMTGSLHAMTLTQAAPNAFTFWFVSTSATPTPFLNGTLVPFPVQLAVGLTTNAGGSLALPYVWPPSVPSAVPIVVQAWIQDPAADLGASASNAVIAVTP